MNLEELNLVGLDKENLEKIDGGCPVCIYLECESHVKEFFRGLLG